MKKVIKIDEKNYKELLMLIHEIEKKRNERISFDEIISLLVREHCENQAKNK